MANIAVYVAFEAKPGQAEAVMDLLRENRRAVDLETGVVSWCSIKTGPDRFAIFETFVNEEAREIHMAGRVPESWNEAAKTLLARPAIVEEVEIVSQKVPAMDLGR